MKRFMITLLVLMFVCISDVYAYNLGTNITIYDGSSSNAGWYGIQEDQEVEPGCAVGQVWDLEGFYVNGTTLNTVGGFDFENGQGNIQSGDIFISTDCNIYNSSGYMDGNGYQYIPNTFGYDYVFDLNFYQGNYTYTLYGLTPDTTLMSVYYKQNEHSNAFQYVSGGIEIGSGTFLYDTSLNDDDVGGLQGENHNIISLDLCNLIADHGLDLDNFATHFTIGCGNDNLNGATCSPVPEPTTILLFGSGLAAFIGLGRRKGILPRKD